MDYFEVNVVGQKMTITNNSIDTKIVEGSQRFVKFKFNLDENWEGLTVFAQFVQNSKGYSIYLNGNNEVYLPPEIENGLCFLVLHGARGVVVATTNALVLTIGKSELIADPSSTEITSTLYEQMVSLVKSAISSPLVANSVSEMVDETKVYVYVGNESGYVRGDWYTFNGVRWVSGGPYNGIAVITDKTLTIENTAADAEAVGNAIEEIYTSISEMGEHLLPSWDPYYDQGKALIINSCGESLEWGPGIPNYDPNYDVGKVLTVVQTSSTGICEVLWASSIPSYSGEDSGKVLAVDENGYGIEWINNSSLPSWDPNYDQGKALAIDGYGEPNWISLIPDYDSYYDIGKVLGVDDYGEVNWMNLFPDYDSYDDQGKVLTIGSCGGQLEWGQGFPNYDESYDQGKALIIGPCGGQLEWGSVLPYYDSSYEGYVLSVDEYGDLEWKRLT